jgi:hypothetical protein
MRGSLGASSNVGSVCIVSGFGLAGGRWSARHVSTNSGINVRGCDRKRVRQESTQNIPDPCRDEWQAKILPARGTTNK